jgi:hypothetical protein
MSNKTPQPIQTKDELRRILAEAVLNTPGATKIPRTSDAPSELKRCKPPPSKRAAKGKQNAPSNVKSRRTARPAKRGRPSVRKP